MDINLVLATFVGGMIAAWTSFPMIIGLPLLLFVPGWRLKTLTSIILGVASGYLAYLSRADLAEHLNRPSPNLAQVLLLDILYALTFVGVAFLLSKIFNTIKP